MFIQTIMLLGTILINFFPEDFMYPLSRFLGLLWYFISKRKYTIRKNVFMITGKNDEKIVKRTFINFIYIYLLLLKLPSLNKSAFISLFPEDIKEKHLKSMENNKGGILVGAHLGGWELAGPLVSALGYKIISVAESKGPGERFFRFYLKYRERFGARIIKLEEKNIVFKISEYLKEGYLIGLISDRDISKTGKIVEFLNGKVSLPYGTSLIARRFKAKVLTGFIFVKEGKLDVVTYPVIDGENLNSEEIFLKIKEYIEDAVRKFPDNWFVFEDIWR
uniref:Lipid A biosynthesis acyltransferase n=1 Tax=candidate division WOR-3 bacterium TaxID=2052148 RepID=A0A7C4YES7_UNCW3